MDIWRWILRSAADSRVRSVSSSVLVGGLDWFLLVGLAWFLLLLLVMEVLVMGVMGVMGVDFVHSGSRWRGTDRARRRCFSTSARISLMERARRGVVVVFSREEGELLVVVEEVDVDVEAKELDAEKVDGGGCCT